MANAPQGTGDASAEGGHRISFGGFDGVTPVSDVALSNREVLDNRIQSINLTTVANDMGNDRDYDDPYPGGPSPSLGNPLDG